MSYSYYLVPPDLPGGPLRGREVLAIGVGVGRRAAVYDVALGPAGPGRAVEGEGRVVAGAGRAVVATEALNALGVAAVLVVQPQTRTRAPSVPANRGQRQALQQVLRSRWLIICFESSFGDRYRSDLDCLKTWITAS